MTTIFVLGVVSAVAFLTVSRAEASTIYNWTSSFPLNAGGTITGSGQLVAADSSSLGYDGGDTGFLVSSITGTYGGATITGLDGVNTFHLNDNLINTSSGLVDGDGVSFNISPSIKGYGSSINIFGGTGAYTDNGPTGNGTFTLTAAAPEPATASLLAVGAMACLFLRRRSRT
jgi:hypothetical protein